MVDYEKLSHESGSRDMPRDEGLGGADASWQNGEGLESAMGIGSARGPAKKPINQGMVLLAIVLLVATGVLFLMRKTGSATIDQSLASVELQIEKALAQVGMGGQAENDDQAGLEKLLQNSDDVVAMFLNDPSAKQVSPENLKKNPFYRLMALKPATSDAVVVPVMSPEDMERQLRQKQLRAELSMLQLQTVMQGRTPIAVISNKVVREQEKLGSFTVVAIEPRSVVLAADGNSYRLTMETPLIETRD